VICVQIENKYQLLPYITESNIHLSDSFNDVALSNLFISAETILKCSGCSSITVGGKRQQNCINTYGSIDSNQCIGFQGTYLLRDFNALKILEVNGSYIWSIYVDSDCASLLANGNPCDKDTCCHMVSLYYRNGTDYMNAMRVGLPSGSDPVSDALLGWQIALIVIGLVFVLGVVVAIAVVFIRRRRASYQAV